MDVVRGADTIEQRRRWGTPTGEPCPRSLRVDGSVEGTGDCVDCGFCLLLAGLVEFGTYAIAAIDGLDAVRPDG